MNRYDQITKTLPKNLDTGREFSDQIEFVLVNFINAPEGQKTDRWVREHFRAEIESGYLRYFITDKMRHFHMSVAKNTAHRLAGGLFLFNLDNDGFIDPDAVRFLLGHKNLFSSIFHFFSGTHGDGSHGRVGLGAYEFRALGGYNESLGPIGYQDDDLLLRHQKIYLREIIRAPHFCGSSIQNSIAQKLQHTETPRHSAHSEDENSIFFNQIVKQNRALANRMTENYTRPLRQKKIGISAVRIDKNNIDRYFINENQIQSPAD